MIVTSDTIKALAAPFPPSEIEWRVGSTTQDKTSGLALAYLTARHVMERLDTIVGPENWQDRYEFSGNTAICYLSLRINGDWITKADGAGTTDVEAEKGQISDCLKRAAVKWGIGRYLYTLGNSWVDIEPAGKSFRIKKDQYAKLEAFLMKQFGSGYSVPTDAPETASATVSDSTAKLIFPALQSELQGSATRSQLDGAWTRWLPVIVHWSDSMQEHCEDARQQMVTYLAEHGGDAREANRDIIEADLRVAMNMDDLKAKWSGWGPAMKKLAPADVAKLSEAKEQVKKAILNIGGKMPDFDSLTPEEQQVLKLAATP